MFFSDFSPASVLWKKVLKHTNDTQVGFLQELFNWNTHFTHLIRSQFILVFDPKVQSFGIVTHRHAKKFIPLWTQVVIDHLENEKERLMQKKFLRM